MKTVLALAAVLSLSASSAFAMCAGHKDVTASVDEETTVASIAADAATSDAETIRKDKKAE